MRLLLPTLALTLTGAACFDPPLPDGVTCDGTRAAGKDPGSLEAALAAAAPGECVLAMEGSFTGAFVVPEGVKLVAFEDASFAGDDPAKAAVTVVGGDGTGLYGARVTSAAGEGVRALGGPAELRDLVVEGAGAGALVATCEDGGCVEGGRAVRVDDSVLRASAVGLLAHGALVEVKGGEISAHEGAALASGYGLVAAAGARVVLDGTRVADNAQEGVLLDGATTRAQLTDVVIANNQGRGVWAQGLRGSADDPALRVEGDATVLENNAVAGLGSLDSRGIIFVNGRVAGTVAKPIPTDLGVIEEVGDGVGLFGGTGEVRLDGVDLTGNARTQLLIDEGEAGIIFVNGTMTGDLKAVIQDTVAEVSVPAGLVEDIAERLGLLADRVQVPEAL